MKIDPNDPAYPTPNNEFNDDGHPCPVTYGGMSIRAEFAKAAMIGLLSNPEFGLDNNARVIADEAVAQADALIAALNKSVAMDQ